MSTKKWLFSGIQPSGEIHIGNYLGAITNWVKLQDEYNCIFCVVDYHSITIQYDIKEMRSRMFNACADLLACGIDPDKSLLFVQSMVPEHTELAWILASATSLGDLERMTQFKDKAAQFKKNVNAGLFTYPILQTADIVLYKAEAVPIGEDQVQHIELAREIVRRFNSRYGDIFPEPKELVKPGARIMGLDGSGKMSKSKNNAIGILEEKEDIWKKLAPAKTDENRKRLSDPGDPEKCNIYTLHNFFSSKQDIDWAAEGCKSAGIGCIDCKKRLLESIDETLKPIREKRKVYNQKPELVWEIIEKNADKCRKIASKTINEVKKAMGLLK